MLHPLDLQEGRGDALRDQRGMETAAVPAQHFAGAGAEEAGRKTDRGAAQRRGKRVARILSLQVERGGLLRCCAGEERIARCIPFEAGVRNPQVQPGRMEDETSERHAMPDAEQRRCGGDPAPCRITGKDQRPAGRPEYIDNRQRIIEAAGERMLGGEPVGRADHLRPGLCGKTRGIAGDLLGKSLPETAAMEMDKQWCVRSRRREAQRPHAAQHLLDRRRFHPPETGEARLLHRRAPLRQSRRTVMPLPLRQPGVEQSAVHPSWSNPIVPPFLTALERLNRSAAR